jgi:putative ABC transport system permease protein
MNRLALRMLFGDHAKYLMLVSGLTFATILMAQGMALFSGLMESISSTLRNVRVPIWVADPTVEQVNDHKPMRDTAVDLVRSVPGVAWAVPFYHGMTQVRMRDGTSRAVTLVGLDPDTLIGAPVVFIAGSLEALRAPDTVVIDEYAIERLSESADRPIGIGDTFELNDRTARVVGICKAHRSFIGGPYVYTTYDRAVNFVPNQRKLLTYILAAPLPGFAADEIARRIAADTGLGAFTAEAFMWSSIWWYVKNTGIPINVGLIVGIGFIIGIAVSGQTFYSFVLENLRNLGALKAMGAGTPMLCGMLILQALAVGFIGYGIGLGIVSLLGRGALAIEKVPFLLLWHIPALVFAAVLFICSLASLLGIAKVARLEPAIVFRA